MPADIIKAAFNVHDMLGCGLLEKVYENALAWELTLSGRSVATQKEFHVIYRDKEVGIYVADLVIDDKVIVEVKAVEPLNDIHRAQFLNYLRISGMRAGLLFNFAGARLQYERPVL